MSVDTSLLAALFIGLLLGVRHALDADHIVAMTAIVSRSRSTWRSVVAGITWGIGHNISLFAAGFVVLVLRLTIPSQITRWLEFIVGTILVLLGVRLLWSIRKAHIHVHQHANMMHLHPHSHPGDLSHDHLHLREPLLAGLVQGLAGSAGLILPILGTLPSIIDGLFFFLVYAIGIILGMLVFSGIISLPFRIASRHSVALNLWLQRLAGAVSIAFGGLIMWQTGAGNSLFGFLA